MDWPKIMCWVLGISLLGECNDSDVIRNFSQTYTTIHATGGSATKESCERHVKLTKKHIEIQRGKKAGFNVVRIAGAALEERICAIEIAQEKEPKNVDDLASEAIFGINGSFFTPENQVLGYVTSDGDVYNYNSLGLTNRGYFVVEKGIPKILPRISNPSRYSLVLESFPMLVRNHKVTRNYITRPGDNYSFRSAVGVDDINNLYFVTTDNSILNGNMISLGDFAKFLESQGFKEALNLDGGKSTQMFLRGELMQQGYRPVVNAITIK